MPTCWIIAGPNGAGKTTFAMEYLPQITVEIHLNWFLSSGVNSAMSRNPTNTSTSCTRQHHDRDLRSSISRSLGHVEGSANGRR